MAGYVIHDGILVRVGLGEAQFFESNDVALTGLRSLALVLLQICHAYGVGAVGLNNPRSLVCKPR